MAVGRLPREVEQVCGLHLRHERAGSRRIAQIDLVPGCSNPLVVSSGRGDPVYVCSASDEIAHAMPPDEARRPCHEHPEAGGRVLTHPTTAREGAGTTNCPPQSRTAASCSAISPAMFQGRISTWSGRSSRRRSGL